MPKHLVGLKDNGHWLAIAILLTHLALSVLYGIVVPLWEAHDEWAHYKYVEYVARNRALPPPNQRLTTQYTYDEASQPPLYYVLAAIPVLAVDTSDALTPVVNPYASRGTGEGGVNFAIHDPRAEGFPWRGTVLAAHLARLVSALMGTLGCLATYLLARLLWPRQRTWQLGALALHAFFPQFLFINSVITNDVLVTSLGAWLLYFAALVMLKPLRGWSLAGLGLCTVFAVLTKYTALALLPVAAVALGIGMWRAARSSQLPTRLWRGLAVGLIAILLLLGAWFWRNWQTTGHLLPRFRAQFRSLAEQGIVRGLAWENLPALLRYAFQTFWASFGWGNVGPSRWVFTAIATVSGLALVGSILGLCRVRQQRRLLIAGLLALDFACLLALPLYQELRRGGVLLRGRYLLPALPGVCLLLVWGLSWRLPPKSRDWMVAAISLTTLAAALWMPFGVIRPAYALPPKLQEADLPERAGRLGANFNGKAELVAYDLWPKVVHPGEGLAVTIWWRALAPIARNYTVGVHLLGPGQQSYGSRNHYPGGGNFATTLWQPGDLFEETYWLEIASNVPVPALGQVAVALFIDNKEQRHLPVLDGQGKPLGNKALFGRLPMRAQDSAGRAVPSSPQYVLQEPDGGRIGLLGFERGELRGPLNRTLPITLLWQAQEPVQRDYTVFVHLWNDGGDFVFGQDRPPTDGIYPSDLWGTGEVVRDEQVLELPKNLPLGTYQVMVGLYHGEEGGRLVASDSTGTRLRHDAIPLLQVEVTKDLFEGFLPYLVR